MDGMKFYFAPLEGITTYIYRNLFHKYFKGVDKYFMPFVAPGSNKGLKRKEIEDIIPENNKNMNAIPQILTNNAENFLRTETILKDYGYHEINLNLGCPVGTVVAKNKGSGMLRDTYALEKFLDEIFEKTSISISIKTRIGMENEEEFEEILEIYNQYPISELIVHPRLRSDYYKNLLHLNMYEYAIEHANTSICYNGDIRKLNDYEKIISRFPATDKVMIGRGMVANPFLAMEIKGIGMYDSRTFKKFHDELMEAYIEHMGEANSLFKMKELWIYFSTVMEGGEKNLKRVRKMKKMSEYKDFMDTLIL